MTRSLAYQWSGNATRGVRDCAGVDADLGPLRKRLSLDPGYSQPIPTCPEAS
jgi:hypothetical protein